MSENMGVNRKQLMKKDAVSQGECISTDLTGNCEVVCLISKCEDKKSFEYLEEEIVDCGCIYG